MPLAGNACGSDAEESTDEAMAAVSVIITAARPVTVVGKMLEHQVEQLHRLRDFRLWH